MMETLAFLLKILISLPMPVIMSMAHVPSRVRRALARKRGELPEPRYPRRYVRRRFTAKEQQERVLKIIKSKPQTIKQISRRIDRSTGRTRFYIRKLQRST